MSRRALRTLSENEKLLGFGDDGARREGPPRKEWRRPWRSSSGTEGDARHRRNKPALEQASQELSSRYLDVEQSNSNLANLYVASYGIHGSLEREEVVRAIHEVLVNLVGTEDFARRNADGRSAPRRPSSTTSP